MIFLVFIAAANTALGAEDLCERMEPPKVERKIELPGDVNYFTRAASNHEVSFATSKGNMIFDVDTGKSTEVPGRIDPVLSPDGALLSVPSSMIFNPKTKKFEPFADDASIIGNAKYAVSRGKVYDVTPDLVPPKFKTAQSAFTGVNSWKITTLKIQDLQNKGEAYLSEQMLFYRREPNGGMKLIKNDEEIEDNYQSLGHLRSSSDRVYRILYASQGSIVFRDYLYDEKQTLKPLGPIRPACEGLENVSLPMISKDGEEFSGYNNSTQTSHVYKINLRKGTCETVESLPALVGKMDFSPNSKKLAFHIDKGEEGRNSIQDFFRFPQGGNNLNAYVFDRKTKSLVSLGSNANEDSYYPVFLDDDRIAYVSATRGKDNKKFFMNVVNISNLSGVPCKGCSTDNKTRQRAALLGYIFSQRCKEGDGSFPSNLASMSKLTRVRCHLLLSATSELQFEAIKKRLIEKSETDAQKSYDRKLGVWDPDLLRDIDLRQLGELCDSEGGDFSKKGSSEVIH